MDDGLQAMIFMGLILKIPVGLACWILWWAWKARPDPAEAPEEDGGQERRRFRREPTLPKGPPRRGGPHAPGSLPLPCPEEGGSLRVTRRPAPALTASRGERRPD